MHFTDYIPWVMYEVQLEEKRLDEFIHEQDVTPRRKMNSKKEETEAHLYVGKSG